MEEGVCPCEVEEEEAEVESSSSVDDASGADPNQTVSKPVAQGPSHIHCYLTPAVTHSLFCRPYESQARW